jgi:hypothetical protein
MNVGPWQYPVFGLVVFLTVVTQLRVLRQLWTGPSPALRFSITFPTTIALIIGLGYVTVEGLAWYDPRSQTGSFWQFGEALLRSLALVLCIWGKAVFGVGLAGAVLLWELHNLIVHGSLVPVPILSGIFDWLFNFGPDWLGTVWLFSQLGFSFVTGTYASFLHADGWTA